MGGTLISVAHYKVLLAVHTMEAIRGLRSNIGILLAVFLAVRTVEAKSGMRSNISSILLAVFLAHSESHVRSHLSSTLLFYYVAKRTEEAMCALTQKMGGVLISVARF